MLTISKEKTSVCRGCSSCIVYKWCILSRDVTIHRYASVPDLNVYDVSASAGGTPTDPYVTCIVQEVDSNVTNR